jgi:dipicolinate synthase subunit A
MREKPKAIMGMRVLITGYGRISKILARQLSALSADVTIAARKPEDLAWARLSGCRTVNISDAAKFECCLSCFDTVVNTVPHCVFTRERLALLREDCLMLDLASKSGVEGMDVVSKSPYGTVAGVKVIWALSLPGKVAPVTAGEIIADTIFNVIHERGIR